MSWQKQGELILIQETFARKDYADLLDEAIPWLYQKHNKSLKRAICLVKDHSKVHNSKVVVDKKRQPNIRNFENYPANSQI